jgi:hypothetical protein
MKREWLHRGNEERDDDVYDGALSDSPSAAADRRGASPKRESADDEWQQGGGSAAPWLDEHPAELAETAGVGSQTPPIVGAASSRFGEGRPPPGAAQQAPAAALSTGDDTSASPVTVDMARGGQLTPPDLRSGTASTETGGAIDAQATEMPPQPQKSTAASRRRGQYSVHAQRSMVEAAALLESTAARARVRTLTDVECQSEQIFLETPVLRRPRGSDRWLVSGGRKGATELWLSPDRGVRRRYGSLVRPGHSMPLKYASYRFITRSDGGAAVEDTNTMMWVVQPLSAEDSTAQPAEAGPQPQPQPTPTTAHRELEMVPLKASEPALTLRAASDRPFISFRSESVASDETGMELGAIVRNSGSESTRDGIKLESPQGDFAEWHRLEDGELPLAEGDVVGFRRGRISRVTHGCDMLGVVTRKAVVEGSAPGIEDDATSRNRQLWDTIAYSGVVPVKLVDGKNAPSLSYMCECPAPHAGQVLVPSGRNDGTAVLSSVGYSDVSARVGILLENSYTGGCSEAEGRRDENIAASFRMVLAVVVTPAETVRRPLGLSRTGGVTQPAVRRFAAYAMMGALILVILMAIQNSSYTNNSGGGGDDAIPSVSAKGRLSGDDDDEQPPVKALDVHASCSIVLCPGGWTRDMTASYIPTGPHNQCGDIEGTKGGVLAASATAQGVLCGVQNCCKENQCANVDSPVQQQEQQQQQQLQHPLLFKRAKEKVAEAKQQLGLLASSLAAYDGYTVENRSATAVSALGVIGCAPGWRQADGDSDGSVVPSATCAATGGLFNFSGCSPLGAERGE